MSYGKLHQSYLEPRGHSSSVSSVLYAGGGGQRFEETKNGAFIYYGDAALFHEWEFRTRLKVRSKTRDHYAEAMSKVVDGLRGDAFVVAQGVTLEKLWSPGEKIVAPPSEGTHTPFPMTVEEMGDYDDAVQADTASQKSEYAPQTSGLDLLIMAMKSYVFPLTTHEAKELFRQYCKPSGSLSRQSGESMQQYTARRRRCWKLLKELDNEIELSEGHRADMLLDLSGLSREERIMIQASIGNARDFEKIADALMVQHPRRHLGEARKPRMPTGDGDRKGRGGKFGKGKRKGKGKSKGKRNFSYLGVADDEDYDVESVESNGSDIETISETIQDDVANVESIGSDSETKSTSCDSTVRNLRLKTASLKRAYYQARQCMYASMQNAKDELNAASCVFMQLTHPENRVSGNNSRKRLRCDVDIVINDLRTILDTQFVSMIE